MRKRGEGIDEKRDVSLKDGTNLSHPSAGIPTDLLTICVDPSDVFAIPQWKAPILKGSEIVGRATYPRRDRENIEKSNHEKASTGKKFIDEHNSKPSRTAYWLG